MVQPDTGLFPLYLIQGHLRVKILFCLPLCSVCLHILAVKWLTTAFTWGSGRANFVLTLVVLLTTFFDIIYSFQDEALHDVFLLNGFWIYIGKDDRYQNSISPEKGSSLRGKHGKFCSNTHILRKRGRWPSTHSWVKQKPQKSNAWCWFRLKLLYPEISLQGDGTALYRCKLIGYRETRLPPS